MGDVGTCEIIIYWEYSLFVAIPFNFTSFFSALLHRVHRCLFTYQQNLLNNLMYRNVQQSSESQSEASSSTGSDWSDNNGIALQMGLDPKDLYAQKFKVDRQKLENMLKSKPHAIALPFAAFI